MEHGERRHCINQLKLALWKQNAQGYTRKAATCTKIQDACVIGIVSGTGSGVRFYRTVFLDEIRREYIRTAAAKGATPMRVYGIHLLRNALVPIITRASTVLPFLFTGSLLLESFFGIPGLGYEGVNALNSSDLSMLKALVLLGAILFIVINLITDVAYAWVDPRVRVDRD